MSYNWLLLRKVSCLKGNEQLILLAGFHSSYCVCSLSRSSSRSYFSSSPCFISPKAITVLSPVSQLGKSVEVLKFENALCLERLHSDDIVRQ